MFSLFEASNISNICIIAQIKRPNTSKQIEKIKYWEKPLADFATLDQSVCPIVSSYISFFQRKMLSHSHYSKYIKLECKVSLTIEIRQYSLIKFRGIVSIGNREKCGPKGNT